MNAHAPAPLYNTGQESPDNPLISSARGPADNLASRQTHTLRRLTPWFSDFGLHLVVGNSEAELGV